VPGDPPHDNTACPLTPGLDSVATARIFYKLMRRLGFQSFYIQGGDWGSLICTNMAQLAPSHVKGLHLNMALILRNFQTLSLLLGPRFGRFLGFTDRDMELLFPVKEKVFYNIMRESGYLHIQATKPDTVGVTTDLSGGGGRGSLLTCLVVEAGGHY
ncbi:PREDICTED: epoxide hydrolase 1-like, partial [Dipodomys ordii]|uniref:Epoxide hydrolase 1-like n=1 Tax=Dipodomys ordii TaxID=10020 RepID=A0A1S3F8Y0_DIPOR